MIKLSGEAEAYPSRQVDPHRRPVRLNPNTRFGKRLMIVFIALELFFHKLRTDREVLDKATVPSMGRSRRINNPGRRTQVYSA